MPSSVWASCFESTEQNSWKVALQSSASKDVAVAGCAPTLPEWDNFCKETWKVYIFHISCIIKHHSLHALWAVRSDVRMLFIEVFGLKFGKQYWEFDANCSIAIRDDLCNTIPLGDWSTGKCVAAGYVYILQEMSVTTLSIMLDVWDNSEMFWGKFLCIWVISRVSTNLAFF